MCHCDHLGERDEASPNPCSFLSAFSLQVYIKDVKSSNGTFVNGERLSPEATESEPYELKSEDHLVRSLSSLAVVHLTTRC